MRVIKLTWFWALKSALENRFSKVHTSNPRKSNREVCSFTENEPLVYFSWIMTANSKCFTGWKVSKYGVISGPNIGKDRPEITSYLDSKSPYSVQIQENTDQK